MDFADTNVLLYAISAGPDEQAKAERAAEILGRRELGLSTQVLQEFYVQATRASRPDALAPADAEALITSFTRFAVQDVTPGIVLTAVATCRRWQISYWDAAIIEAARALGCATVLSEDLSGGQDYGGVVVRNPFLRPA